WENAGGVNSLPGYQPPRPSREQTPQGPSGQDQHVVDDQAKRIKAARAERSDGSGRTGQLAYDNESDGNHDPVPDGTTQRTQVAGHKPTGDQGSQGQHPHLDRPAAVTAKPDG